MRFDRHTYLPSACKHCYNLFTCMALTTRRFWMSPQSTLPDGADTAALCSTSVPTECSLPSASPSPLLTLLSIPVMFFSSTSSVLCLLILISTWACSQPLSALWAHPKPCLNMCLLSVTPISSLLMPHLETHKSVYFVSPLHRIIKKFPG